MWRNLSVHSVLFGFDIEWSSWFNIGVQIFLFISGYLYGNKKVQTVKFYKKNYRKLLVDYYIFVTVMVLVYLLSSYSYMINAFKLVGLYTFTGLIDGLGNLWFMRPIIVCYFFTPFLLKLFDLIKKKSLLFWPTVITLTVINHILVPYVFGPFIKPEWLFCFLFGIIYRRVEDDGRISAINLITIVIGFLSIPVEVMYINYPGMGMPGVLRAICSLYVEYGRVFLGAALVIIIRTIYRKCVKRERHIILDWSDKYSYDVYLVHHVFIASQFALVEFIPVVWIELPLSLLMTIVSSVALGKLSTYIRDHDVAIGKSVKV